MASNTPVVTFKVGQILTAASLNTVQEGVVTAVSGLASSTTIVDATMSGGTISGVDVSAADVTVSSGTTAMTLADKLTETVSIHDFGAVGDGSTDCTDAINAALSSGVNYIFIPQGTYYCTGTVTIPPHVCLYGLGGPLVDNPPGYGAVLLFENTVSVCVQIGTENGTVHLASRMERVSVVRQGGSSSTIPSGSIGVKVSNAQGVVIRDVVSYGHDIGFYALAGDPDGITLWIQSCNTGRIQTSHLVVDSFPEVRISDTRFGMNGTGDLACTNFVSITGGNTSNTAGGPNTIAFTNCQFNQGANTVTNWINFNNQLTDSVSDTGLVMVTNCYVETISYGIVSDSTWTTLRRLLISNTELNKDGAQWFNLDSATTLQDSVFGNIVVYGNITLDNTFDHVSMNNIILDQALSITSASSSSTLAISNIMCTGAMTLAGAWSDLLIHNAIHGTLTNSATGNVHIQDGSGETLTNDYTIAVGANTYEVTFGTESALKFQNDGNFVVYNTSSSKAMFSVNPATGITAADGPLQLGNYTVADLPTSSVSEGCSAYATDGLKPGESSGSGTGVPVFYSANGSWYSMCAGTVVSS